VAQARSLDRSAVGSGLYARRSGIRQPRLALAFSVAGGLSFWLPDVLVHIEAGRNFDSSQVWAITILQPAAFLLAYLIARRYAVPRDFRWVGTAMVLGVWLTGGLVMTLIAASSGSALLGRGGFLGSSLVIVLSIVPIVTYIMAAYDGSLFALLAVTAGALLLWGVRAGWMLLTSGPSSGPSLPTISGPR
jgi:hypothetical protein